MATLPQTISLRVQQLAAAAQEPVDLNTLAYQALIEYHGTAEDALRALIPASAKATRKALDSDQDLPDEGAQLSFFPDSRDWIIVHTPDRGDLLIPKDHQTVRDVYVWAKQRRAHHRVQDARFDSLVNHIETYGDPVDERRWIDARPEMQKAKTEALETGRPDDT